MLKYYVAGIGEQDKNTNLHKQYRAIIQDVDELTGYKDTEKEKIIVGEVGESAESVDAKAKAYVAAQK